MKATIPCRHCEGSGKETLPEPLRQTLMKLGKKRATSEDLREEGVTREAINNRLEQLRELGFVSREREGRFFLYFRST